MSKVEEILKKIGDKIEDITVLNIQTVISPLEIAADGAIKLTPAKGVDGMTSTLDLIDGDIRTVIAPSFYEKYPELVQFHQSKEAKGSEIIEANMNALKSIISIVGSLDSSNE